MLSAVHNVFHVSQLKKCHPEMAETPLRDIVLWRKFNWKVISLMKKSQSRFWRQLKGSPEQRPSNFARFSGTITQKMKQPGKEKKILKKTIFTFLLANPNLEDEIHLKGVRFVTS